MHPQLAPLLLTIIDVLELPHVTTLPYPIILDPQTIPMISNVWAKKPNGPSKTCRPDAPMGAAKRGPGCAAFTEGVPAGTAGVRDLSRAASGGNGEPRAPSESMGFKVSTKTLG